VAVAHLRRLLLGALDAADAGQLPPGSALSSQAVRLPNALEALLPEGQRWEEAAFDRLTS
jgi:hypothetical protein